MLRGISIAVGSIWVIASHIAKPGSLNFDECFTTIDDELYERNAGGHSIIDDAVSAVSTADWPKFELLSIQRVWSWLTQIADFRTRSSKSKLGRAIGAITYLINPSHADENVLGLVWALIGLEALYGNTNQGLRSQLLDKSEAYLGPRSSHSKQFGWMYDFRSRFIHGDLDFVFQHHDFGGDAAADKFIDDAFRSQELAIAMLIATVQRMCIDGRQQLAFEYVVTPSASTVAG